jgi:hypothetical protein
MDSGIRLYRGWVNAKMRRLAFIMISIILLGIGSGLVAKYFIVGGNYTTAIAPTSLREQIYQAVRSLQVYGGVEDSQEQDLTVTKIQQFKEGEWVAATVAAGKENPQDSSTILKKVDGRYQIVVAPGTNFGEVELKQFNIPDEVIRYVDNQGQLNREQES